MGRNSGRIASFIVALWGAAGAVGDEITPNPWRIEVDGGADSHGEIVFAFPEDDVEIVLIPVAIPSGAPENKVARRIRKEFRRALPKDDYGVDLDGGENVLTSARGHAKRFEFRLMRNTVNGTEISTAHE